VYIVFCQPTDHKINHEFKSIWLLTCTCGEYVLYFTLFEAVKANVVLSGIE